MNSRTDQQLLQEYAEKHSDAAFAELVRRHVDLVYSAALRMVCDSHQAEDVSQGVFIALAQNAERLTHHPVLSGWLHRTTQNLAANAVRATVRRQAREQEAVVMNELLSADSDVSWKNIAPHLDDALGDLSEQDRDALLLRYFERKSAREMAEVLGITDEAAQRRVSRAVERLREVFSKRGVSIGASGLVVVISANAVQAAPVGLALNISTAAALTGTTLATTATVTATKAIAMTTLQKTLIGATLAAAISAGIFQAHQASELRKQNQAFAQQQVVLAAQIQQLQSGHDTMTNQLAALSDENARLKAGQSTTELLHLRSEAGTLRQQLTLLEAKLSSSSGGFAKLLNDPATRDYIHQTQLNTIRSHFGDLFKELKLTPEQTEQVVSVMGDLFMKNTDQMYSQPQGKLTAAEIAQATAEREAELASRLQPLIGDSGVAKLREYRESIPAEGTLALLNGKLGASQLTDDQNNRLRTIIKSEPFDLTRGISGDWDPAFWGTPADIEEHMRQITQSNQRVAEQAGGFLTPDQLTALRAVLSNGVNERFGQAAAFIQKH